MIDVRWGRAVVGGVAGVFAGAAAALPLLFAIGPMTIFNEDLQSPKVTAVWGEIEPLPLMVSNPMAFAAVLAVVGVLHGLVFGLILAGLPSDRLRRGLTYGLVVWLLSNVYFELNAPFAMLGEPAPLVAVELAIQFVGAMVEGLVIAAIYGTATSAATGSDPLSAT